MFRKTLFVCSLMSGFLMPSFAFASDDVNTPITFTDNQNSDVYKLASIMFGSYLKDHSSVKMEVAEVDLNSDGVAEVAVRLKSPSTCNEQGCATSVMMYMEDGWKEVFHHRENALGLNGTPSRGRMRNIVEDDNVLWTWDGSGRYKIDIRSIGTLVPVGNEVKPPIEVITKAAEALHVGIEISGWLGKTIDLGIPGDHAWWVFPDTVEMEGSAGRNMVLVVPVDGEWQAGLVTITGGNLGILPTKTDGVSDIVTSNVKGLDYWKWIGNKYKEVATSYVSNVTPAP